MLSGKAIFPSLCAILWLGLPTDLSAQTRPARSRPPQFSDDQFRNVFFPDVTRMLRGKLPTAAELANAPKPAANEPGQADNGGTTSGNDPLAWNRLISPVSLEDLIKGAKLALDQVVTTPQAFASGGYAKARLDFSMLAVLFAVIEVYPDDIRWKDSSAAARELLARVAANTKVGSQPVYNEAKLRLIDLGDLTRGTQLDYVAKSELNWSQLIDREPLMQLLEMAYEENIDDLVASQASIAQNPDKLRMYAELVAVLGRVALADEMPDADDDDYQAFCLEMIQAAGQINLAIETSDAELARQASAAIGQSCSKCHDDFR